MVLDFILKSGQTHAWIKKIILFGSRARGDNSVRSDYDLAVEVTYDDDSLWPKFALNFREKFPSLCGLDLININSKVSVTLLDKIAEEGVIIYDKS